MVPGGFVIDNIIIIFPDFNTRNKNIYTDSCLFLLELYIFLFFNILILKINFKK
jgi:hypothetical protein